MEPWETDSYIIISINTRNVLTVESYWTDLMGYTSSDVATRADCPYGAAQSPAGLLRCAVERSLLGAGAEDSWVCYDGGKYGSDPAGTQYYAKFEERRPDAVY